MEEEKKDQTPTRSRHNFYKILTIVLGCLVLLVVAGYATVEATSSSTFCGTCHEMNPESNTWKASAHSNVACKECHIQDGVINYAKAKLNGLNEVYKKTTDTYAAPIHMPDQIPNSTCEKCHDMKTRNVTAPGDIIIPHDKHLAKDIKCVQCHSGVAHGSVADRNVTFKTDYDKWDASLGKQMMSDTKFTEPKMDDCISCHQARKVSTDCKTCHTTKMVPKSHKEPDFKTKSHGLLAAKDIKKCNDCHKLMSKNQPEGFDDPSVLESYLNKDKVTVQKNEDDYAKENTFCKDCHSKKPASHTSNFFSTHGTVASKNLTTCKACHDVKQTATPTGNQINCSSCHPASHSQKNFKDKHPIPLDGIKGPSETCYKCHDKPSCTKCHKEE